MSRIPDSSPAFGISFGLAGIAQPALAYHLAAACALLGWQLGASAQPAPFNEWLEALKAEAMASGISRTTVETALSDVEPEDRVIERDRNQPESRLEFWTYADRVVSDYRIEQGRRLLEEHRALFQDVARRYGVPAHVLVATWAIESNFGRIQGSFPVVHSLVTLAYDGRRATFFRGELLNALRILDAGHIDLQNMNGSWAGAMGQVQFMPSTFVDYARDGDGDGRIDIWRSTADAIESAANYMGSAWRPGYIWGRQVRVPSGFDTTLAGLNTRKRLAEWESLGIRRADGTGLPTADITGSIVLPTEATEPAFLVYDNYRAIMRWNRSHLFAISLGHLADRIAGKPPLRR